MKAAILALLCACTVLVSAAPSREQRTTCTPNVCEAPDCRCIGKDIPSGLSRADTPQFVMFTFDDAVNQQNVAYYDKAFTGRTNPNGCPASATFFVSHEFTEYNLVHHLYQKGHEIALHSISHVTDTDYWKNITVSDLVEEFSGEREIVARFGMIPKDSITGIRLPFLQMSGDHSFKMMEEAGFEYDSSWPSQANIKDPIWPYTLDFVEPRQDCPIGPCPDESHPSIWVMPMNTWNDDNDVPCAMVDSCQHYPRNNSNELLEFMIRNFERHHYNTSRAPFGFYVHAAWFNADQMHFEAYLKFIDYLQGLPEVYIVNKQKVLEWIRDPIPLDQLRDSDWSDTCRQPQEENCGATPLVCKVIREDVKEERWFHTCYPKCPNVYPWLGNPKGDK